MNCKEFEELNIVEKVEFIGKLTHLVQTYETAFKEAKTLIRVAEESGLFKKITINPEEIEGQIIPPLLTQ